MKGMKKVLMAMMVLSIIVVFAAPAVAKRYTVDVLYSQVLDDGTVQLFLRGDGGKERLFDVPAGAENRMLAQALTALSTGLQLKIEVPVFQGGQVITEMQLLPAP